MVLWIEKIDGHFENSCIWVTNIKEKATWCSEKTRELFNIKTEYVSDFEYHILKYVHLFDKDEYITDIRKRLNGENLDNELLIQLERPEFRQEVRNILAETGFPSGQVCLELTERCKDFPLERLESEVEFLHSCGIRVAMDDYGTGSASSNIVMNIPMDEIKIDMSFIRGIIENPKNQAMVRSIVDFANECDMDTCLEGVENEELQDYLREFNATWFQGYYYSRPISADELLGLLTN